MKQWEMGRSQTPLPPERRAEVPWLFIRLQTGTGVLVCCTIPTWGGGGGGPPPPPPFRCECAERMSETATLKSIVRRLDSFQNNVSGLNRRMITLESNLSDRVAALEARMAGLEDRADELVDRIGALATGLNSLVVPTDYAIRTY